MSKKVNDEQGETDDGPNRRRTGKEILERKLLRRIAEQGQPIKGGWFNTSQLIRRFTVTFAAFKNTRVMPQDKEVEVKLKGIKGAKSLMIVQKLFQQTIDPFDHTTGAASAIEQG